MATDYYSSYGPYTIYPISDYGGTSYYGSTTEGAGGGGSQGNVQEQLAKNVLQEKGFNQYDSLKNPSNKYGALSAAIQSGLLEPDKEGILTAEPGYLKDVNIPFMEDIQIKVPTTESLGLGIMTLGNPLMGIMGRSALLNRNREALEKLSDLGYLEQVTSPEKPSALSKLLGAKVGAGGEYRLKDGFNTEQAQQLYGPGAYRTREVQDYLNQQMVHYNPATGKFRTKTIFGDPLEYTQFGNLNTGQFDEDKYFQNLAENAGIAAFKDATKDSPIRNPNKDLVGSSGMLGGGV